MVSYTYSILSFVSVLCILKEHIAKTYRPGVFCTLQSTKSPFFGTRLIQQVTYISTITFFCQYILPSLTLSPLHALVGHLLEYVSTIPYAEVSSGPPQDSSFTYTLCEGHGSEVHHRNQSIFNPYIIIHYLYPCHVNCISNRLSLHSHHVRTASRLVTPSGTSTNFMAIIRTLSLTYCAHPNVSSPMHRPPPPPHHHSICYPPTLHTYSLHTFKSCISCISTELLLEKVCRTPWRMQWTTSRPRCWWIRCTLYPPNTKTIAKATMKIVPTVVMIPELAMVWEEGGRLPMDWCRSR